MADIQVSNPVYVVYWHIFIFESIRNYSRLGGVELVDDNNSDGSRLLCAKLIFPFTLPLKRMSLLKQWVHAIGRKNLKIKLVFVRACLFVCLFICSCL